MKVFVLVTKKGKVLFEKRLECALGTIVKSQKVGDAYIDEYGWDTGQRFVEAEITLKEEN